MKIRKLSLLWKTRRITFILGIAFGYCLSILTWPSPQHSSKQTALHNTSEILSESETIELSFPPPRRIRYYHQCNYENIPYVSDMLESAQYILYHNTSFIRFADADMDLMMGKNRSYQESTPELQEKLLEALLCNFSNVSIGIPNIFQGPVPRLPPGQDWYYDRDIYRQYLLKRLPRGRQYLWHALTSAYTSTGNTSCILLPDLYSTLRQIWANRDIVILRGNNSQNYEFDIYDTARSQVIIYSPRYRAWSAYEQLKENLFQYDNSKLFILTCGPTCKVLAHDLVRTGRRALDLGHLAKDYDAYYSGKRYKSFFSD